MKIEDKMDLAAITKVPDLAAMLWDLYAEVNRLFAENEEFAAQRREVARDRSRLRAMEKRYDVPPF